jgi:hypothetical protein
MNGIKQHCLSQSPLGRRLCLLGLLLLLAACGKELSPEEQVRRYIAEGVDAVEARELTRIRDLISEQYTDPAKRTRRDLTRLVGGYLLRHKSIHLLTHVNRLEVVDERHAEVELYVAMAGSPITGVEQLLTMRADLHRFEMKLGKGEKDNWQLLTAKWRRATTDDFMKVR